MEAKRRLTDLFVVGRPLKINDGEVDPETGEPYEPIEVYVRKLNAIEHETALRRANAARSAKAAVKNQENSDEYMVNWEAVEEYSRDGLISYLLQDFRSNREPLIEAELADDEEWSKNNYLLGLQESWLDGLKDRYAEDPTDAEALRVFEEMKRFNDALDAEINAEVEAKKADLESKSDLALQKQVFEKLMSMQASIAWLTEYRKCEVWLCTRLPDKKTKYFESREEVDEVPPEVFTQIADAYREISVEPTEGKD